MYIRHITTLDGSSHKPITYCGFNNQYGHTYDLYTVVYSEYLGKIPVSSYLCEVCHLLAQDDRYQILQALEKFLK